MSLLELDSIKNNWIDKNITEFEAGNSKEYKVNAIQDSTVYANKAEGHLPCLYYLVLQKEYPKEKNTWQLLSAVQHLKKLINSFHKKYLEKPTKTSPPINSIPPMARHIIFKSTKPINSFKRK